MINTDDVKVFRVNEYDGVAAESLEKAKEYYMEQTGMSAEEAFYDFEPEEVSLNQIVWDGEEMEKKITLSEVIKRYWKGEPFIAFTSEI